MLQSEEEPPGDGRVSINYHLAPGSEGADGTLPFVIGVLADLNPTPILALPRFRDRRFVSYDLENFGRCMRALQPSIRLQVDDVLEGHGRLDVAITFESLEDFSPNAVVQKLNPLRRCWEGRSELAGLVDALTSQSLARSWDESRAHDTLRDGLLAHGNASTEHELSATSVDQGGVAPVSLSSFTERIGAACRLGLLRPEYALSDAASLRGHLEARISETDRRLDEQVHLILRHDQFRTLEGSWRGLYFLVSEAAPGQSLRVKVLNISKRELFKDLEKAVEFDQSSLFKKVYEQEYGSLGGEPFGLLIGDYLFDNSPEDVTLLKYISGVAACSHLPFVAGVSPGFLCLDDWHQLNPTLDPDWLLTAPRYRMWQSLSSAEDSDWVFLVLPRILAPSEPGTRGLSADDLAFGEMTSDSTDHCVMYNASYALAAVVARKYRNSHWLAPMDGPVHGRLTGSGDVPGTGASQPQATAGGPVAGRASHHAEHGINRDLAARLRLLGLNAVTADAADTSPYFADIRPVSWWWIRQNRVASSLACGYERDLPGLLCVARFAHHIRCFWRDHHPVRVGEPGAPTDEILFWLRAYARPDPCELSQRARFPLAYASVAGVAPFSGVHPIGRGVTIRLSPALGFEFAYWIYDIKYI